MNWEAIGQFFVDIFHYLYENYSLFMVILIVVIMALIIGLLALLKMPIKALTNKIHNETVRKLANKVLIVIAFGLSVGIWYLLEFIIPTYVAFEWNSAVLTWALSITAYELGDGIITKSKSQSAVETIKNIMSDGKVDESDRNAIAEFYDKVK